MAQALKPSTAAPSQVAASNPTQLRFKEYDPFRPKRTKDHICDICQVGFASEKAVKSHKRLRHASKPADSQACQMCSCAFGHGSQLMKHYLREHGEELNIRCLSFNNEAEFKDWKLGEQTRTGARYVKTRGTNNGIATYMCDRSGASRSQSGSTKRTKKIGVICTARMIVSPQPDGSQNVKYFTKHCGHELEYVKPADATSVPKTEPTSKTPVSLADAGTDSDLPQAVIDPELMDQLVAEFLRNDTNDCMKRKRRHSSPPSDLSEGEIDSSSESSENEDTVVTLRRKLAAAESANTTLQNKLTRRELDLENSQKYAASLRDHAELLTSKIQQHRTALSAARDALAAATTQCSCSHLADCPKTNGADLASTAPSATKSSAKTSSDQSVSKSDTTAGSTAHTNGETSLPYPGVSFANSASSVNASPAVPSAPLASEVNTAAALASAAEEGMRQAGFVYDSRSGMYYDFSSGYYYDQSTRLYYDNNSGVFYTRDAATGAFDVHHTIDLSAVVPPTSQAASDGSAMKEGNVQDEDSDDGNAGATTEDELPPPAPCIRAIVLTSEKLKVGSLFVVTCDGGTIGRDRDLGHAIRIPELVVSKVHAKIEFDDEEQLYFITDYGSRNGTFINSERLSESQVRSEAHCLKHGDQLQVGMHTRLLCHIHAAGETCNNCEPGQVQAWLAARPSDNDNGVSPKVSHKQALNRLKSLYGLARRDVGDEVDVPVSDGFKDRAAARRSAVGVDQPPIPSPSGVKSSSVDQPIGNDNKGRRLLEKLGWQDGDGLGQRQDGMAAPISVQGQARSRSGIGFSAPATAAAPSSSPNSGNKWQKAQARFEQVTQKQSLDMFAD
ncbi:angiogenic factor with G patch and FHA domains 1-like isoform X1 [Sycon ciliatum]|uniref:angiogenic factor with G patch and FHA domains 1-like isoform X1 n=3 Tax=Sycon ciliatum TaxID=27933 RepID=UPI0031F6274B